MNKKEICAGLLALILGLASPALATDRMSDLDALSSPQIPSSSTVPQIKTQTIKSPSIQTPADIPDTQGTSSSSTRQWSWKQPKTAYPAAAVSSEPAMTETTQALPAISATSGIGSMKGPADIKKPKITVPAYQNRYDQMLKAKMQAQAEMKKQAKLFDRIMNEIGNYGIYIIVALVLFIIVYTIWKEKETDEKIAAEQENIALLGAKEKKDIWSDDF